MGILYMEMKLKERKESVKVLQECIDLQLKKSQDYQSDTIHDIILGKITRATSLLESGKDPNFESLEDTYKDMINYASFAVSYMRGKMEGQQPGRDMFNKPTASTNGSLSGVRGKSIL